MKKSLLLILLLIGTIAKSQSINKAWIDNETKLSNAAFDPIHAQYYINNTLCDAAELNQILKNWSPTYTTGITVQNALNDIDPYLGGQPIWLVNIIGIPDPLKKKVKTNCKFKDCGRKEPVNSCGTNL